jgi:uncharacterized protein with PhoU and TrkA domain
MGEVQEVENPMDELNELFLEMKDTSELMVDLAYSSLLFNDMDIAAEVERLGDIVEEKSSRVQRIAAEEISCKSADATLMILRMVSYVMAIADAALQIVEVVQRKIKPHPILKQSIIESDVGIFRVRISKKSILSGKSLGSVRLATETGMWVIAVRRGARWIYGPQRDEIMKPGDHLFVKGPEDGMKKLRSVARGRLKKL